jgi:hypothetical protein
MVDLHDILRSVDMLSTTSSASKSDLADQAELLIHHYHAHEITDEQFIELASNLRDEALILDAADSELFKQQLVRCMNRAISLVKVVV